MATCSIHGDILPGCWYCRTGTPQCIDLTGMKSYHYIDVITDAGTIRVNAGLVNTANGRDGVVVEIEPGLMSEWETEVHERLNGRRTDVILTRWSEEQHLE